MMCDNKIGIVGLGTVGNAVYQTFSPKFPNIALYDPEKGHDDFHNLFDCEFIFMCLPTPKDVMDIGYQIADYSEREDIVFIVKSTLPIGYTEELQHMCGNQWCFNPEFLTDRTAVQDFQMQHRVIIGGTGGDETDRVEDLYKERFPHVPVYATCSRTAEFVKLMTNLFFMNKISFMNEMYDMAQAEGLPWAIVMKLFVSDGRISPNHLEIGLDGERGFGGKCFPENLDEMLRWMDEKGYDSKMIKAIKDTNDKYR